MLPLIGCATKTVPEPSLGPAPPRAESEAELGDLWFVSNDGAGFPSTRWIPESAPETVIVAVHGLSGAASDFWPLGEDFSKRSTAVYSYALRGQGNDPDRRRVGDIRRKELWLSDLDTFMTLVRAEHPEARVFLYGESLGGLISVHGFETLSADNREAIEGLILSSPVVSLKDRNKLSRFEYFLLQGAIRFLPRRRLSLERLAGDKVDMNITGGTDHLENVEKTPHAVKAFSFRLLGTLEKMIDSSGEKASGIEKPILVMYPAHDLLTTAEDVEAWFATLETPDKEKHLFEKSYHLLLHDQERGAVLRHVRNWLERH